MKVIRFLIFFLLYLHNVNCKSNSPNSPLKMVQQDSTQSKAPKQIITKRPQYLPLSTSRSTERTTFKPSTIQTPFKPTFLPPPEKTVK